MQTTTARLVVVGPGAIGGVIAALLARSGRDVTLVCKSADLAARVAEEGVRIRGERGSGLVTMKAVNGIESLHGGFDYALVAVKATDREDAARRLLPFLGPQSLVVSMQNGICVDALAAIVGTERVVGCSVGWGSTLLAPADIDSCKRLKSSSLQSLGRGRKTEIDFFNGYIVRTGAGHGVETPVNTRIAALVHEIEQGTRRIGIGNLAAAVGGSPLPG